MKELYVYEKPFYETYFTVTKVFTFNRPTADHKAKKRHKIMVNYLDNVVETPSNGNDHVPIFLQ